MLDLFYFFWPRGVLWLWRFLQLVLRFGTCLASVALVAVCSYSTLAMLT